MSNRQFILAVIQLFVIGIALPSDATAQLTSDTSATDFAVYAGRDVHFQAYSTALGDVYAGEEILFDHAFGIQRTDRNHGDFYSFEDITAVGGLHDFNGSMWANRDISFDTDFGVEVTGNATYGGTISNNAYSIVEGTITQTPNSVPSIPLPPITTFSSGVEDYVEGPGQSVVVLQPGVYRDVSLSSRIDALHLSSGDYYMRRLDAWISAELHLDLTNGPINVFVENDVFFESGLTIFVNGEEISSTSGELPQNVELAKEVTFEAHGDFTIDSGFLSNFFGTVYTPFGDIQVDTENFYGAAIAGRNVAGDFYIEHYPSHRLAGTGRMDMVWDALGDDNWNTASWLGGDQGSIPDAMADVSVTVDTVTVAANAFAHSLAVDNGGSVMVDTDSVLAITGDLLVNDGLLDIASTGAVTVGFDVMFGDTSIYVSRLAEAEQGMITAAGNVSLLPGSTLVMQATAPLSEVGQTTKTVLSTSEGATIDGTFTNVPTHGEHLGHGAFFFGWLDYADTTVDARVFQADYGDVDGNGSVDIVDIFLIKASEKGFGTGATDADWTDGDMVGAGLGTPANGIVDLWDIFAIKQTGLFGSGPYAASGAATKATSVPEPSTILALLSIALTFGGFSCNRGRRHSRTDSQAG